MTVFADSHYHLALFNRQDPAHVRAVEFSRTFRGKMVTTAWVLTEVADGMAGPYDRDVFVRFFDELRIDTDVKFIAASSELFDEGIVLYRGRSDKDWSLTDCISFVVMSRENLTEALTGDRHFQQAGFHALLMP